MLADAPTVAGYELRLAPDPILLEAAARVENVADVKHVIAAVRLIAMTDGVAGIAAPQIGEPVAVCAVKRWDRTVVVMVNPVVKAEGPHRQADREGCLSLPGTMVEVERASELTVAFTDRAGVDTVADFRGHEARIAAHEIDHLNGVLITDRALEQAGS